MFNSFNQHGLWLFVSDFNSAVLHSITEAECTNRPISDYIKDTNSGAPESVIDSKKFARVYTLFFILIRPIPESFRPATYARLSR